MIALIETAGTKANIYLYNTEEEIENEMKRRYNRRVKEVKKINWNNSWIDIEEKYARVDDWEEIVEWRVGEFKR